MSAFTGPLTITQLDQNWKLWRLEQPLRYEVGKLGSGRIIEVPVGFVTDGASIPRILWSFVPAWGRYSRSAVIHDYGLTCLADGLPHPEMPTRLAVDNIFLEAMGVSSVSKLVKLLLYWGVKIRAHQDELAKAIIFRASRAQ